VNNLKILAHTAIAVAALCAHTNRTRAADQTDLEALYWQHQPDLPVWLGELIWGTFLHDLAAEMRIENNRAPTDGGIVYTRQPRAVTPVPGSPIAEASNWQHASDVGRISGGIAEADVVLDDLRGNVTVIHDCTQSARICVAQEARVSPDGERIVYSVGYGEQLVPVRASGVDLGIREIPGLTHARLFIYDRRTGVSTPVPGHDGHSIDRQPEWLDIDLPQPKAAPTGSDAP